MGAFFDFTKVIVIKKIYTSILFFRAVKLNFRRVLYV